MMAYSKRYGAAAHKVMKKLGIGGQELYTGLYQDIFWWTDNHPEYEDPTEAYSKMWAYLKEHASVPDLSLMDSEARQLIKNMMQRGIEARDHEASVNRKFGNRVKDSEFKVQSFVNQEMVDFYRLPMELGFATMPRTINDTHLLYVYNLMDKAGWSLKKSGDLVKEANLATSSEAVEQVYKTMFTDAVVEHFVKPHSTTDVRQNVFRGPKDQDGDNPQIGNSFIFEAFEETNGDVFAMANYIYDQLAENQNDKDRLKWQQYFLRQWNSRWKQFRKTAARVQKDKVALRNGDAMKNTPQSLDARMVESRLPREFFYYNQYDEVTSNIRLAMMSATAAFGRNGKGVNDVYQTGRKRLNKSLVEFNEVMSQVTKGRHQKPRPRYSRKEKADAYKILEGRGVSNPQKHWDRLYSDSIAFGEFEVVFNHLKAYYGEDNAAGPLADANLLLDLMGSQALMVLNNVKSSFWQTLSLFEFPNAFRGLNRMAGKGTAAALGNFVNQTFGGIAETFGAELGKTGRYSQYLNNTHFKTAEAELPFNVYNTQVGEGGKLAESIKDNVPMGLKRWLRTINNVATHHRAKPGRNRAPIDILTAVTGIFPYINNVVNHSVGVGAIHSYSDLVYQVSKYIEDHNLTEYKEFTPEDLGMGEGFLEVVKGEKDGYDRMNKLLVAAGAPSISRLAFDYVDRKKSNPNAFIIDENTGHLINQIAMNQIAGEGYNSRPAILDNNKFLRHFNTFLGWPLGKFARDMKQIVRDPADRLTTYQALIKYIAITGAAMMPLGLSYAMLVDWYDEDMLKKPNNLPPITPWAALPILGLPIAMRDEHFNLYSVTSRLAKAGVPFGMGMDLINSVFAKGDPYGSAREFSLDSRIFAFNMFKNITDALGTWAMAGEFDWQLIGRPIAYGLGGNSILQMMDLTTALMDIDSEERRVADYIGMRNYIKSTAWLMGLDLRPPYKGGGKQSAFSINTRQMARAAYNGDTKDFLEQYQEALESAREHLASTGSDQTPEQYVLQGFKTRDLRSGITASKISDTDWESLLSMLPDDAREKIEAAERSHQHFIKLIGGEGRRTSMSTNLKRQEARQRAALMLL
jgi:hypothetical protein